LGQKGTQRTSQIICVPNNLIVINLNNNDNNRPICIA